MLILHIIHWKYFRSRSYIKNISYLVLNCFVFNNAAPWNKKVLQYRYSPKFIETCINRSRVSKSSFNFLNLFPKYNKTIESLYFKCINAFLWRVFSQKLWKFIFFFFCIKLWTIFLNLFSKSNKIIEFFDSNISFGSSMKTDHSRVNGALERRRTRRRCSRASTRPRKRLSGRFSGLRMR